MGLKLKDRAKDVFFFFDFLAESAVRKVTFLNWISFSHRANSQWQSRFEAVADWSLAANRIGTQKFVDAMIERG